MGQFEYMTRISYSNICVIIAQDSQPNLEVFVWVSYAVKLIWK